MAKSTAVSQRAAANVNCRIFPGVAIASVQAQLQRLAGEHIAIAPLDEYHSSDASPLRPAVITCNARRADQTERVSGVTFVTARLLAINPL